MKCRLVKNEETGDEVVFEIRKVRNWDIVEIYFGGKRICSGDWYGNLRPKLKKFMRIRDDRYPKPDKGAV